MKKQVNCLALLLSVIAFTTVSCSGSRRGSSIEDTSTPIVPDVCRSQSPTHYKLYLENSGSVKGYFKGISEARIVLTKLTDRLEENFIEGMGDTISFHFISNKIQSYTKSRDKFLDEAYVKCNAAYSELDKNLNMVIDNLDENSVGLLISDFCFESKDGNWDTAQSGITKLFTRKLNNDPDMTIAIFKYNVNFDGKYFPGGIKCKKKLPIYVWAFGSSEKIKRIVNLKVDNDGVLIFQSSRKLQPKVAYVSDKPAKGRFVDNGAVVVKEWDKNRKGIYSLNFEIDVNPLALSETLLNNIENYNITDRYFIKEINYNNGICNIIVNTEKPAPGSIQIEYPYQLPLWVEESNFEGSGLPDDGTTLGFKFLVKGVFDAYNNKYENYFSTIITLK